MRPFDILFLTIASDFTRDIYFLITRVQGVFWSIANTAIVYVLLKIAGRIRMQHQKRRIRIRYVLLLITAGISLFLPVTRKGNVFFALEAVIYGIQYLILLITVLWEGKWMARRFQELVSGKNET